MTPSRSDARSWDVIDAHLISAGRVVLIIERRMRAHEPHALSRGHYDATVTHAEGLGEIAYTGPLRVVRSMPLDGREVVIVECPVGVDIRRGDSVRVETRAL